MTNSTEPSEVHEYLTRVLYNRRNKFNPLWNSLVVGGVQLDGSEYLGAVDLVSLLPLLRLKHAHAFAHSLCQELANEAHVHETHRTHTHTRKETFAQMKHTCKTSSYHTDAKHSFCKRHKFTGNTHAKKTHVCRKAHA